LLARCLEKQPGARPSSVRDALDLLEDKSSRVVQPAPRATPTTNFHGRETELARIEETLRPGGPGTLVLTGPAGVGKSALCQAAAQRAHDSMWIGAGLSTVEGPLTTLVEAARAATLDGDDPATSGFGPGGSRIKGILRGDDLPVLQSPEQALWTLQSLLVGVASTRPLVLCVDDAQHASEEDVELLVGLARQLADRPFTLMVATRPESPASAGFAGAARLDLGGLEPEPIFALLEDRLEAGLPGRIAEQIWKRTEGNPLQAVELARHLEESGSLVRRGGRLEASESSCTPSVPTRLRDIVHARLSTLDDVDRSLLEVAAVDGLEFDGRALAATLGLPMLQVLRRLQALCRSRALIAPSSKGYRFADLPTQEVLYEDMAPELLTELHRTLAEHLEQRDDEIDGARLGRHWERCGNRARAAPYLFEVAKRARDRQELRRYVDFAKRAGVLEEPPLVDLRAQPDLVTHLAATLMRRGDREEAENLYARLARCAEEDGSELLREQIAVRRASAFLLAGNRPDGDGDRWRAAAERLGETEDGGIALSIVGRLAKLDGDFQSARAAFEQADEIFSSNNLAVLHATMQGQLGAVALRAGRMEDARALYSCSAATAEKIGLANNAAVSRTNAALAGMQIGDIDGVETDLRRSIRTFDLAGWFGIAAQARLYLAEVLFAHGDTKGALEAVESALPDLERADHQIALANAVRLQAEFLAVGDRLDEAAKAIARALEHAQSSGDRAQIIVAQAVNALIATAQERDEDAAHAIEAIREANPDGTAAADGAVLILCEAVHLGLPTAELESVGSLARTNHERLLREATLGFLNGFPFGPALEELERCKIGLRHASYQLLIDWLAAQQAIRSGDDAEAKKRTAAALKTAATFGHVRAEAMLRF
jgi:tetratricopeptide (TPR) repeat protein